MRAALENMERAKERLGAPDVSEDEASDIENDLTYIIALPKDLQQLPA